MKRSISTTCLIAAFCLPQLSSAQNQRFPDIPADRLSAEQKIYADHVERAPRNAKITNMPYKVYLRSPEFADIAMSMTDYLRWKTSLSPKQTELVILLAAHYWSSGYVWRQHHALAMKAGMDPQIPAAIAAGKRPEGMNDDEAVLYDLITQLYQEHDVSDATYNAAVAKFGEKGLVDAIFLAGYYGITAFATFIAKTPWEPGNEPPLPPRRK